MIFLNKAILIIFIKSLNIDSAYKYLNYFGYKISKEDAIVVLPYLKSNLHLLDKNNKDILLENLPKSVSYNSKEELIRLFDKYV